MHVWSSLTPPVFLPAVSRTLSSGNLLLPAVPSLVSGELSAWEHVQVKYREATPPNEQLVVRSNVVSIKDNTEQIGGGKPAVQVDLTLHQVCFPAHSHSKIPTVAPCLDHMRVVSTMQPAVT